MWWITLLTPRALLQSPKSHNKVSNNNKHKHNVDFQGQKILPSKNLGHQNEFSLQGVMHFNINGLKNKTQLLESEICDMKNLNFLCITEHHLTGGDYNDINISNYKIASIFSRSDAKCGGSLIMTNVDSMENVIIKT